MSGILKWDCTQYKNYETITNLLPKKIKTFYDPFCGSLNISRYVLENCEPEEMHVSDSHRELIHFYYTITYKVEDFLKGLKIVLQRFDRLQYYKLRKRFSETDNIIERAVAFYILAKTCKGVFPRDNKILNSKSDTMVHWDKEIQKLEHFSEFLKNKKLLMYEKKYIDLIDVEQICEQDFIYFDLPKNLSTQEMHDLNEFLGELKCDWLITTQHAETNILNDWFQKKVNSTYFISNSNNYLP